MMKTGVFTVIALGLIICFALTAGCAKLPEDESESEQEFVYVEPGEPSETGSVSPTEIVEVTISTPIPTETIKKSEYSIPPDYTESVTNYTTIYSKKEEFRYTTIPFDIELNEPPMIFEYELDIKTMTDQKAGISDWGDRGDYSYDRTIPHPNAFYSISVYNSDTAELFDSKELKQFGDTSESGIFKIFNSGNYHVEITGNLLTANTTVKVPPANLE